jgi:septal ring factor EnvC (AmiA/AmiB activator)
VTGYGHAVRSFYAGKVAFVGNSDHLGNYVIIDLGLDVKLWYCFLGETYVKSGDIIAVGEIIGTTGELVNREDRADGFAYIFTYLDYIISPEFIFENNFSTIK